MRRNGVWKSGKSTSANRSATTQKRWMCVNSDNRHKTATISNCNFVAETLGQRVQPEKHDTEPEYDEKHHDRGDRE